MVKRKCMNKRLSRYSKQSTCSDLLDPNTDIEGNEYSYWWKNLENNTLMRPSMGSDIFQQSSRHLDTNSEIETSKVQERWWNELEYSDTPDSSKMYKNIVEKTAVATSTSESEEEPRITKKKIALRTKVQKPKGNVFLDVLNGSAITTVSESIPKTKKKSSTNNSASSSKMIANVDQSNKVQENSSNQSHSANEILKVKPNIYKKNTKRADENLFTDVLKEGELETPSKGQSVRISSNRKSLIVSGQTEALVSSQTKTNRFVFSFENEQDFSPLRVPNAQSTILDETCSSMSDTNNNREHEVLKPKPKFFVRQNKNTGKNLFEMVLESDESSDTGQKSKSVNKNSKAVERLLKPLEIVQTSKESIVEKDKTGRVKELKILNGSKEKHKIDESRMKSVQNVKEIDKSNLQTENYVSSSEMSDHSQHLRIVQKLKPEFLTKSRKNGENNLFQDILTDDDLNLDPLVSSKSKTSLNRSKIENSVTENVTLIQEQSKNDGDDRESSGDSTKLQLSGVSSDEDIITPSKNNRISRKVSEVPSVKDKLKQWNKSEANDVQIIPRKGSKILSTSNKEEAPSHAATQELESEPPLHTAEEETEATQSDNEAIPLRRSSRLANSQKPSENSSKRQSGRLSKTRKHPIVRITNQSEPEEIESTAKRSSKSQGRVQKEQVSAVIEEAETLKGQESSKKQSGRLSKTRKRSSKQTMGKSETEEIESSEKRSSKRQKRVQKESVSAVAEEPEVIKNQDSPKKQSDRLSKTQKRLSARTVSESEPEEIESISKRNRSRSRTEEEQVSSVAEEAESIKNQDALKRQSNRLSKSQERTIARSRSESKSKEDNSTGKRDSRSQNQMQKESVSAAVENTESTRNQSNPKRHSERLSKLPVRSLAESIFEFEPEETEITSKRDSRNRVRVQKKLVSVTAEKTESIKNQDDSKKQSDRLSKSQGRSITWSMSESDSEEIEIAPKRDKSQNKIQEESIPPVVNGTESIKDLDTPKRQIDDLSKSQKRSLVQILSQSGPEDTGITLEQHRNQSRMQNEVALSITEKIESTKKQDSSEGQSDRFRKPQESTIARTRSKSKSKEPEITSKRNRSRSRTQEERVSPVTEETESPKNQDTLKRPSDRLSESQEPIIAQTRSKSKLKEDESTTKRGSRSQNRMQNESTSAAVEKTELAKNRSDSRRHSDRLSKLPVRPLAESIFEFEPEETEITSKRDSRNRVRMQKKSISVTTEKTESMKDQSDVKMQSDRLSKSQYSTARSRKDSKSEEMESTVKRDSKSRNKAQKESISAGTKKIESTKIQDGSKKQSDRLSKSQRRFIAWVMSDSDSEETEITPKQDSRTQSQLQKESVSAVVERLSNNLLNRSDNLPTLSRTLQIENGEAVAESVAGSQSNRSKKSQLQHEKTIRESIPKKPSESFAKTAERFELFNTDESGSEEAESEEKTQERDSIRSQMPSVSTSADEMDAIDNAGNNGTQNDRLMTEDSESEEEENRSLIGLREDEVENNTRKTDTGVTVSKRISGAQKETGHRNKAKDLMSPMVKTSVKSGSNILKGQKSITNFFKMDGVLPAAQVLSDKQKADEIKRKLEKVKEVEMARMTKSREEHEEILRAREKRINEIKKSIQKSKKPRPPKKVNRGFIMNGVVYSIPRLSRPQKWITDRLYHYLWKCMEPKYKLDTKAVSEKFVVQMSNMTKLIMKHKSYLNYKNELHLLMREMARLGIIHTRHDFYQFAHDFFPYELRAKTVPMILPGNEKTIPYSPEKLHEPILDS